MVWGITGELYNKTFWISGGLMNNPYPSLPTQNQKHPYVMVYNRGR
jgi:hypothetical protein